MSKRQRKTTGALITSIVFWFLAYNGGSLWVSHAAGPDMSQRNLYIRNGDNSFDRGQYVSAVSWYSAAIDQDPSYARAYILRAIAYRIQGRNGSAASDYWKACELGDRSACEELEKLSPGTKPPRPTEAPTTPTNSANVYLQKREYTKAIAEHDNMLSQHPNDAMVYFQRGTAYYKKGQYVRAASDFQKACDLGNENGCSAKGLVSHVAVSWAARGLGLYEKGQCGQAIEDCSKALSFDPYYAEAYFYRGLSYAKQDQHDKAIEDFNAAIKNGPYFAEAYFHRGNSLFARGNRLEGAKDWKRAASMGDKDAQKTLAKMGETW